MAERISDYSEVQKSPAFKEEFERGQVLRRVFDMQERRDTSEKVNKPIVVKQKTFRKVG